MVIFPELNTKRLKLRKLTIDDVPSLLKYANNKKIADAVLNIPHPYQEPDAVFRIRYVHEGFKDQSRYIFAIVLPESGEMIGEISLHLHGSKLLALMSYWIGEPFWNQGFATEAAKAVLAFGMERLNLGLISAECTTDNKASEKVLINIGMKKGGSLGKIIQYRLSKQQYAEQMEGTE